MQVIFACTSKKDAMQAVLSILTQQKTARRDTRQAVVFIALCGVLRTNDRAGRLRVLHLCGTFGRQKCPKSPGKRDGKSRRLPVCGAQSRRLAVAHAPLTAAPFPARFFCPRQRSQAKPRTPLRNVRRKRGSAGKPLPLGEVAAARLTERVSLPVSHTKSGPLLRPAWFGFICV